MQDEEVETCGKCASLREENIGLSQRVTDLTSELRSSYDKLITTVKRLSAFEQLSGVDQLDVLKNQVSLW